jgi:hypothetical protein
MNFSRRLGEQTTAEKIERQAKLKHPAGESGANRSPLQS